MKLNPYLNYGGNCKEAFEFYAQNLGGKINAMIPFGDQPGPGNAPPDWKNKIMHANMSIGQTEIMASDAPPDRFQPMRSVYLSLQVESTPEAERIYKLLSEAGDIFMPMEETFFAHRFAMLRDKFGTSWMILHQKPMH
jgi:PhnB protein